MQQEGGAAPARPLLRPGGEVAAASEGRPAGLPARLRSGGGGGAGCPAGRAAGTAQLPAGQSRGPALRPRVCAGGARDARSLLALA